MRERFQPRIGRGIRAVGIGFRAAVQADGGREAGPLFVELEPERERCVAEGE